MPLDFRQQIHDLLISLPTHHLDSLKQLFWSELNYDRADQSWSTRDWPDEIVDLLAAPPNVFASIGDQAGFRVLYIHLKNDHLLIGQERQIIRQLHKQNPYSLYIFSNQDQDYWHFVNIKYQEETNGISRLVQRRIVISPEERLRTATERISMLDIQYVGRDLFDVSPLAVQQLHDQAFDVEKVTQEFFNNYVQLFIIFKDDLLKQSSDLEWAHDFALQFLNRVMFLYYVQRKRWLDDDPEFLSDFWSSYRKSNQLHDTFVENWLNVLFFKAFNDQYPSDDSDYSYFPENIRNALRAAPYLNGGLFLPNELDNKHSPKINDGLFKSIFAFFEGYNFTISEDTPLDQEVSVDPEMIGKVYESLVNVSEEVDERGEAGIFYTPRVEIDLMCRLSLVDWLSNHLGDDYKSLLYEWVFAFEDDDKNIADQQVTDHDMWPQFGELVKKVTVLDPACGSGSFLVGMLYVLDDLNARVNKELGDHELDYFRKKRIIANSLYGVDVMRWAIEVAELRLWLQLVFDTPMHEPEQLTLEPLLPNLSFKLRVGDSLVQEIGGMDFTHQKYGGQIPSELKGQIRHLQAEKLNFYNNEEDRAYQEEDELLRAEYDLFCTILSSRALSIEKLIIGKKQALRPQKNLFGDIQDPQMGLKRAVLERDLQQLKTDLQQIQRAQNVLEKTGDKQVPFVWDIAFVEICAGDNQGFDIVIGNPPYVRQEEIRDPLLHSDSVTIEEKREYKKKLAQSIYRKWPLTFGFNFNTGTATWTLDAKSDLYIYFYFYGLSLLNSQGTFCFITSNSWLDVGYGADLQKFLITRSRIKLIIDNQIRRSFSAAEINTVIAVFSAPEDTSKPLSHCLDHISRFVMSTVPFEQTLSPVIWEEIEEADDRRTTEEYRLSPVKQSDLLNRGIDISSEVYAGDKWGGKYLRAPEIYWYILEKNADKLVRLGDIANVRFGIKTGANSFFFLDSEEISRWDIEDDFLIPALKNTRDVKKINVNTDSLPLKLFICNHTKKELKGTNAIKYIEWGESLGFHKRPSCSARPLWWSLGAPKPSNINCNYQIGELQHFYISPSPIFVSNNFQIIHYDKYPYSLSAVLNCSWTQLYVAIMGRTNLGGGLLKIETFETANIITIDPEIVPNNLSKNLLQNGKMFARNSSSRMELDELVFDCMNLSKEERDAVVEKMNSLVEARLQRAQSL